MGKFALKLHWPTEVEFPWRLAFRASILMVQLAVGCRCELSVFSFAENFNFISDGRFQTFQLEDLYCTFDVSILFRFYNWLFKIYLIF